MARTKLEEDADGKGPVNDSDADDEVKGKRKLGLARPGDALLAASKSKGKKKGY